MSERCQLSTRYLSVRPTNRQQFHRNLRHIRPHPITGGEQALCRLGARFDDISTLSVVVEEGAVETEVQERTGIIVVVVRFRKCANHRAYKLGWQWRCYLASRAVFRVDLVNRDFRDPVKVHTLPEADQDASTNEASRSFFVDPACDRAITETTQMLARLRQAIRQMVSFVRKGAREAGGLSRFGNLIVSSLECHWPRRLF